MPKYFSKKNEKIICSQLFKRKNAIYSFMLTSENRQIFLPKSKSPFQKWTKKMSKNENPKYFSAKMRAFLITLYRDFFDINCKILTHKCSQSKNNNANPLTIRFAIYIYYFQRDLKNQQKL
jgi:hypothetical protein